MVCFDEKNQDYVPYNLDKNLVGTVYYFEININDLKEERGNENNNL